MNKLIAIVGMAGSGKSVASTYFTDKGYALVYFGGVIYEKMQEENIPIDNDSQREFREKLREEHGMGVVAKLLLPKIEKLYKEHDVVLDGLYSWDEYKILKEAFPSLIVVCIINDKKLRYQRIAKRKDRPFTEEEMITRDISEIENSAKGGPIAYADYYILNDKDINDYQEKLDKLYKMINEE